MLGPGQEAVFAPRPPLEAFRTVLGLEATDLVGRTRWCRLPNSEESTQVSFVDIPRACFNAKIDLDDPAYVAMPGEDPVSGRGICMGLRKPPRDGC